MWTKSPWTCNKEENEAVKKCVKLYFAFKEVVLVKKRKIVLSVPHWLGWWRQVGLFLPQPLFLLRENYVCVYWCVFIHRGQGIRGKSLAVSHVSPDCWGWSFWSPLFFLLWSFAQRAEPLLICKDNCSGLTKPWYKCFKHWSTFERHHVFQKLFWHAMEKYVFFFILFSFTNKNHLYFHYVQVLRLMFLTLTTLLV